MSNLTTKKILPSNPTEQSHANISVSIGILYSIQLAYGTIGNSNGLVEYVGFAPSGTLTTQPRWFIKKLTYNASGQVLTALCANGESSFDKVWDSREGYSYS